MTDRVKIDPKDIKVGDLIEAETLEGTTGDVVIYRGVVIDVHVSNVYTDQWYLRFDYSDRTFYRLPKPAPDEPKNVRLYMNHAGSVAMFNDWIDITIRNGSVQVTGGRGLLIRPYANNSFSVFLDER